MKEYEYNETEMRALDLSRQKKEKLRIKAPKKVPKTMKYGYHADSFWCDTCDKSGVEDVCINCKAVIKKPSEFKGLKK